MLFSDWFAATEDAASHARIIREKIVATEELDPVVLGALNRECDRLLRRVDDVIAEECPRGMVPEEWAEPANLLMRTRLRTMLGIARQRPESKVRWLHDLRLATEDYVRAWEAFARDVEH